MEPGKCCTRIVSGACLINLVSKLDELLYPGVGPNWDDSLFRTRIVEHLRSCSLDVLDLGAGAGIVPQMNFRGLARRVCGVDPDPRVITNPHLDEGRIGVGERIPYPNGSFDLIFADNVLEHLAEPQLVFCEVQRLLRPGGIFLVKTPNRWHYVPLAASLTPHGVHQWFNKLRGRMPADTFPTRYKANSVLDIRRLAGQTGLEVDYIQLIEGRPEYLRISAVTYVAGWLYERLVNSFSIFEGFRVVLIAQLRKPMPT
jgi:SAM-dependent methyltransferase